MTVITAATIGANIRTARRAAGLTQAALGTLANVARVQIVRMESGLVAPGLDEAVRLAAVLRCPLDWLTRSSATGSVLQEIAVQLYRLGVRDLVVADAQVPGSFRHPEEVLVLAVSGDRPEPRVIEAIPFVLASRPFHAPLVTAFARRYDFRARNRIAWLADVTIALGRFRTAPVTIHSEASLRLLVRRGVRNSAPDSLGHPSTGPVSPIWRRWSITYAGTINDFANRIGVLRALPGAVGEMGEAP